MNFKKPAILWCIVLLATSWLEAKSAAPKPTDVLVNARTVLEHPEFGRLTGKWIVRSVKRDGPPNQAQVGQEIGDIITINPNNGRPYVT